MAQKHMLATITALVMKQSTALSSATPVSVMQCLQNSAKSESLSARFKVPSAYSAMLN